MPKKKATGYSLFVNEFKKKMGIPPAEAYQLAAEPWNALSDQAKKRYNDTAKEQNDKNRTANRPHVAGAVPYVNKEKEFQNNMKEAIIDIINSAHERLFDVKFYLLHINMFFYKLEAKRFYPAEIGLARFSLADGLPLEEVKIKDAWQTRPAVYHRYVNPGTLPTGYAATCKLNNHKISYPARDGGSSNVNLDTTDEKQVFQEVLEYIRKDLPRDQRPPPLFTSSNCLEECTNVIKFWLSDNGFEEDYIRVYAIEDLLFHLNSASVKLRNERIKRECKNQITIDPFDSCHDASLAISKDNLDFTPDISCDFHEISDLVKYCSKSLVTRWCYTIFNFCVNGWDMTRIKHYPKNATVNDSKPV